MGMLLKQIWYRRRSAAWLFIELAVLSAMAWMLSGQIMRVCVSFCPRGCAADGRLQVVTLSPLDPDMDRGEYVAAVSGCFAMLENSPEVASALLLTEYSVPSGTGKYNAEIYAGPSGKMRCPALFLRTVSSGDYGKMFSLFGIDLVDGSLDGMADNAVVITEDLACTLFPEGGAVGRTVTDGASSYTVGAVAAPIKTDGRYEYYSPCIFLPGALDPGASLGGALCIAYLLKEGADPAAFAAYAERELLPEGVYVQSSDDYARILEIADGFSRYFPEEDIWTGVLMLVLVFLGTVSYFWMNDRSCMDENGIRMTYGATRAGLGARYLVQAFVIATAAFLVSAVFVVNVEVLSGGALWQSPFRVTTAGAPAFIADRRAAMAVVAAVIYGAVLLTVLAGTLLCALRLRGRTPVDMMR